MNRLCKIIGSLSGALTLLLAPALGQAQTCDRPFGYTKNSEFVFRVTDKGRSQGTISNKVVQQDVNEEGIVITTFKSSRISNKRRAQTAEEFHISCKGDTSYFDAMMLLKEQALKTFSGKDFEYFPEDIAYPHQMQVGATLPPAKLGVQVKSSTIDLTYVNMNLTDRKVEGREKITTPAGAYDCFKIVSNYTVQLEAMGLNIEDTYKVEEYFSPQYGLIKCQFTNKKGKKGKGIELLSRKDPE